MKYFCEYCNYGTYESSNFNHHNNTKKHERNKENYLNNNLDDSNQHQCKYCNKVLQHQPSKSRHVKKCKMKNKDKYVVNKDKINDITLTSIKNDITNDILDIKDFLHDTKIYVLSLIKLAGFYSKQANFN